MKCIPAELKAIIDAIVQISPFIVLLSIISLIFGKKKEVEINAVVKKLKEEGRVRIKEGHGMQIELLVPAQWRQSSDQHEAVFLLYELFQIRTLTEQFSEVSLDVVEYATKPTIYHSPVNRFYEDGPILDGMIKFSVIKQSFWNSLLYSFGQPLVFQPSKVTGADFETNEYFPLLSEGVKELFLSPEGDVKILKG